MNEQISGVLARLEKQSELERSRKVDTRPEDRMLAITRETGVFYNIMLRSSGAKRVLEIGMSVGYSTLWFADAVMASGGRVTTIEQNPSKIGRARTNFDDAGVDGVVEIVHATALDALNKMRRLNQTFDFVFIDADKENCKLYFEEAFKMLNVHGIVGTDNMLHPIKYRQHMRDFADHIRTFANATTVTLAIGNGQELTVKTGT